MAPTISTSTLSDDELVEQMHDDLYDGLKEEIEEGVRILLARGWTPYDVLTKALVEGMRIVGVDFRDGILFVPEVLMSANAMKAGMFILRPLLAETGAPKIGKMVIGTVKGDIHDIGKNLVCMMMEGAGFEVIDLGINNPVENYLEAIEKHQPDILGMSALLTTTMPYMKVVIDTLKEKGMRNDYVVLVGGAPAQRGPSPTPSAPTPIAATPPWRSRRPRPSWPRRQGCGAERAEHGDGGAGGSSHRRHVPDGRDAAAHPRHRLRGAGARAPRRDRGERARPSRRHLPAGHPAQPAREDPRGRARARSAPAARATTTSLPLRRLRHRRHARRACWTRRASSASPARTATSSIAGARRLRRPARARSPAPSSSPTTWSGTSTGWSSRASASTAIPELLPVYFGNYSRVVYLAQRRRPALPPRAEQAAERLGLRSIATGHAASASSPARPAAGRPPWLTSTILYWRDIPAQVIARAGAPQRQARAPAALHRGHRHGRDALRRRATDDYLADWRRGDPTPCGDDLEAEADAEAAPRRSSAGRTTRERLQRRSRRRGRPCARGVARRPRQATLIRAPA